MAAKTYDYIITLKQTKSFEAINWITQLVLFLSLVLMSYTLLKKPMDNNQKLIGIIFIVATIIAWIYSRLTTGKYKTALYVAVLGFLIFMKSLWFALALIVLVILESFMKFKDEIGFDEEGVTFNSFPKRSYQWHEVTNVILKDGILTVDLHNNKIFQKELESDTTPAMEREFNEFCRSQMFSILAKA